VKRSISGMEWLAGLGYCWLVGTEIVCYLNLGRGRVLSRLMMGQLPRTYVQKDGTVVPHAARPVSVRISDFIASIVLFFTLFFHSLFEAADFY
jgi:hypothetical protein